MNGPHRLLHHATQTEHRTLRSFRAKGEHQLCGACTAPRVTEMQLVNYFEPAFFRFAGDRFLEAGASRPLEEALC